MNLIQSTVKAVLPAHRKMTPTGWESFNAVCCHHRGENRDTRKRGGIIFKGDGFTYHCFNCHFKAGWTPGHTLSANTRKFMSWLGIPDVEINKLVLEAIKAKNDLKPAENTFNLNLEPKFLPENCKTFDEWVHEGCEEEDFLNVIAYVLDRKMELDWYPWMWSAENGYRDRVIIPYYYEGTIVGWTGRKITEGKPKYLTSSQPSYVFNLDRQDYNKKYVIVLEANFDAIALDGVAVASNELNDAQIARINALGKEVIVVPDNDIPGTKLITTALEQGWSVSLPEWGRDIKDAGEAVEKFGRVYTLYTILKYREHNPIKITMIKKRIEQNATEK
jgi:hypothetical protein